MIITVGSKVRTENVKGRKRVVFILGGHGAPF